MLLDLRETVRNSKPIKYTLITIITIPFALVGIGSYLTGGSAQPVAEVNGQPIDANQLERAYQQQRQQLARMFGGRLPEAFANEQMLREQALQQLISQQVLESEVAEQNFAVGDETLGRAIRNLPAFQVDGRFDSETYQNQLRSSGMSVAAFEQSYRDDTAMNQFRIGISETSFTLLSEAERLSALARQTRTIDAVRLDAQKARADVEVSDEDIAAYFEEHKSEFEFPPRARIRYIELDSAALAQGLDVTEEEAMTYYEENRSSFIAPEQREASHILLSADEGEQAEQIARLNELKVRIEGGESFADLAREFSDDVGSADLGGSLGVIAPGAMVAEFEEAAYALQESGDVSEPVVTEFGVHLIKLDSITPESGKAFEDVKEQIIADLQLDQADREFFELRELLSEQSFDNPGSLGPASEATGLEIKTSEWLDRETDSGPVLSSAQVQAAVFSPEVLEEELNSELIEVGDRQLVVLRVVEHEGPRPKTLDDVRDEVTDALKAERASEQLAQLQEAALTRLAAGDSVEEIARESEYAEAMVDVVLDRQYTDLERSVVSSIFALPRPGDEPVTHKARLNDGDLLALRLTEVSTPEIPVDGSDQQEGEPGGAITAGADPRRGGTEFEVVLESMRNSADIEIRETASP